MAQPSSIESHTMQIDFFDTMMIERLNNQELVSLLPLVSRAIRAAITLMMQAAET